MHLRPKIYHPPLLRILIGLVRCLLGPFGAHGRWTITMAVWVTLVLTLLTQVGGLILWPFWSLVTRFAARFPKWKRRIITVLLLCGLYLVGGLGVLPYVAKRTGRVRLPIIATETLPTGPLHIGYAILLRNYVRSHTYSAYTEAVQRFGTQHPDVVVRYLDAGFAFPTIPLLPHLSHRDGQRIDVAFLFSKDGAYIDKTPSPIGYWGYAQESPPRPECAGIQQQWGPISLSLRWDFEALQAYWPDLTLDIDKNRALFHAFVKDPRVCSILLEPGLHPVLSAPKLRKNGCGVARHDDHFHLTIRPSCGS